MQRFGPGGPQRVRSGFRAGETQHLVPCLEQFFGEDGADKAGRAREEDTHRGKNGRRAAGQTLSLSGWHDNELAFGQAFLLLLGDNRDGSW